MANKKIKGKIIRIIDTTTVVINLGSEHGVSGSSIFYVLAEPEQVIDPETHEVLGTLNIARIALKANQVFERFTVAVSEWTQERGLNFVPFLLREPHVVGGELNVSEEDLMPWRSREMTPVKPGDEVEVSVPIDEEDQPAPGESSNQISAPEHPER